MSFIKGLLTDENAKYVAAMIGWFAMLLAMITGLFFGGFLAPNIILKVIIIVVGITSIAAWLFMGCVMAIRMLRVS